MDVKMIKSLANMAVEEAEGACKYAKLAVENKRENPVMAEAVANLATQELTHMTTLMQVADKMAANIHPETSDEKARHEAVMMFLDWTKEKQSEKATMAHMHLEQYKSM